MMTGVEAAGTAQDAERVYIGGKADRACNSVPAAGHLTYPAEVATLAVHGGG